MADATHPGLLRLIGPDGKVRRVPGDVVMTDLTVIDACTGEVSFAFKQVRPNTFHRKRRTRSMRGK